MLKAYPSVSIIILTKNSARTLDVCLNAIIRSKFKPREVIIVDGGSTDNTLEIARDFQVSLIISDEGKGLGYARDIGWRASSSDYALFVDSDVVIKEDFIQIAMNIMEKDRALGALAGKLEPICHGKDTMSLWMMRNLSITLHKNASSYPDYESESLHTAVTMFRREALEKVGGFDRDMKLALEDWTISYRLLSSNYNLAYVNNFSKHLETPNRFRKMNIKYGRSRVHCRRKGYPIKIFPLRLKLASLCIIFPTAIFPFASYYFYKHKRLNKDITCKAQIKLGFIEVWRLMLRALGAWLELLGV
ncbi:MAG: glycosyltransferase [archaeon]|nr:glycosyltransferase [archaeon]MCP8314313.1 glycosyltransferase [archaeon]MCP8318179.1 glycosyltransferase [archaeon]MCP8319672.1 glycosyltransferase [archaeon]